MYATNTFVLGANPSFLNVNFSGQFRGSNDSANAPTYAWSNDLKTGFYRQSSNVIGAAIAGVNALTIGSNVGIETLTPQYDLDVKGIMRATSNIYCGLNGTMINPCYSWQQNSNTGMYWGGSNVIGFSAGGSNRIVLGSNVGIGTSSPVSTLHVAGATTVMNQVPSQGLVTYYPFDANANDAVGANNLTATGTPTYTDVGKVGKAVRLTGGANFVRSNTNFALPLTVSCWIMFSVLGAQYVMIMNNNNMTIELNSSSIIYSYYAGNAMNSGVTIALNTWYHVTTMVSSSGGALYVNGTMVYSSTTVPTWSATSSLNVGSSLGNMTMSGWIDDFRIYNRVLSASEVSLIYQNQVGGSSVYNPVQTANLVSYYPFDGNANDTVGTNNMSNSSSQPPTYVSGFIGNAVNFSNTPGASLVVQNLTKTSANLVLPLTIGFWARSTVITSSTYQHMFVINDSNTSDSLLCIQLSPTGYYAVYNRSAAINIITSTLAVANRWDHVVVTIATSGVTIYVNNIVIGTQLATLNWNNANNFSLGGSTTITGGFSWNGAIDDLRIYNRVLSPVEVNLIYKNQATDSRLGIGLATPQYPLDVVGNASFTGNISAGNLGYFRNRIINGNFIINQRLSNSTVVTSGVGTTYVLDRFLTIYNVSSGALTVSRQTLSSSADTPFSFGHQYSMRITATTACAFATGSYIINEQRIEGYNTADLGWGTQVGSPITVSFWVRTNAPSGSIITSTVQNIAVTDSYITNTYITATNTWQYVSYTVPPPPSGGVWSTDNTTGVRLHIGNFSGSTLQTSLSSTWVSGNYPSTTTATNIYGTLNNYIEFTGVQLEKGTIATPFEFRPTAMELQLCQRYFVAYNTDGAYVIIGFGYFPTTTSIRVFHNTPVPMRSTPTIYNNSTTNYSDYIEAGVTPIVAKLIAIGNATTVYFNNNCANIGIDFALDGSTPAKQGASGILFKHAVTGCAITFNAEL